MKIIPRVRLFSVAFMIPLLAAPIPFPAKTQERGLSLVNIRVEDGKEVRLYEHSYALVIGVSDYTAGWPKLPGVKKDVEAVARALERHGFQVTKVENPDSAQFDKAFKEFIDAYGRGVENRLVFYFAGHGYTVKQSYGGEMGYIVPADAPNPNRDQNGFMSRAIDMQQVEVFARRIQSKHALFLFDSCFSGSIFALSRAVPASISYKTAQPVRQFITSGSADEEVPDKSVFREQFVEAIAGEADVNKDGYVTGSELGEFLQDKVVNYSRSSQHPQYGKIRLPTLDKGDFVFALPKAAANPAVAASGPPAAQPKAPATVGPAAIELSFWESIKASTDPADFKAYLDSYPSGRFAALARNNLRRLEAAARPAPTPAPNSTVAPNTSANKSGARPSLRRPKAGEVVHPRSGIELVYVPAGEFMRGAGIVKTPRRVTIPEGFWMGRYEITQAQWKAVMGQDPSKFKGESRPVENVEWDDVQTFIRKLNETYDDYTYRLPTDEEWLYASQGGESLHYPNNLDQAAWYLDNSGGQTHPVGQKKPNGFGLYDMFGNVSEYCNDRSEKGWYWSTPGSWFKSVLGMGPGSLVGDIGFRVVAVPRQ